MVPRLRLTCTIPARTVTLAHGRRLPSPTRRSAGNSLTLRPADAARNAARSPCYAASPELAVGDAEELPPDAQRLLRLQYGWAGSMVAQPTCSPASVASCEHRLHQQKACMFDVLCRPSRCQIAQQRCAVQDPTVLLRRATCVAQLTRQLDTFAWRRHPMRHRGWARLNELSVSLSWLHLHRGCLATRSGCTNRSRCVVNTV